MSKQLDTYNPSIKSIRKGNTIGKHKITFRLEQEKITLQHESFSRKIFAKGAILSAKFLLGKPNKLYSLKDALLNPPVFTQKY